MRIGVVAVLLAAFATARADEQEGACAQTNWVCVAECIDRRCADECLRGDCEQQLSALRRCPASEGCDAGDGACGVARCEEPCVAAFGAPAAVPSPEPADPCEGMRGGAVPKELVGTWNLHGASMEPFDRRAAEPTPQPRPDYAKVLRISPTGCFVMELELGAATLGEGNGVVVRGWGTVTAQESGEKKLLAFHTISGRAAGNVCGKPRAVDLFGGQFRSPVVEYDLKGKDLYLTRTTPDRQTFQFAKGPPQQLPRGQTGVGGSGR